MILGGWECLLSEVPRRQANASETPPRVRCLGSGVKSTTCRESYRVAFGETVARPNETVTFIIIDGLCPSDLQIRARFVPGGQLTQVDFTLEKRKCLLDL